MLTINRKINTLINMKNYLHNKLNYRAHLVYTFLCLNERERVVSGGRVRRHDSFQGWLLLRYTTLASWGLKHTLRWSLLHRNESRVFCFKWIYWLIGTTHRHHKGQQVCGPIHWDTEICFIAIGIRYFASPGLVCLQKHYKRKAGKNYFPTS